MTVGLLIGYGLLLSAAIGVWLWARGWQRRLRARQKVLEGTKEPIKLSQFPARTDMTDRECVKLIGGTLGCLMHMADPDAIRRALRWWNEEEQAWGGLLASMAEIRRLTGVPPFRPPAGSGADPPGAPRAGHGR